MRNELKKTVGGIIYQASMAIAGLEGEGSALGLQLVDAPGMKWRRDQVIEARALHFHAKRVLADLVKADEIAMETARQLVISGRDLLKNYVGRKPCGEFDDIGLKGSLAIPRSPVQLCAVLSGFKNHFTQNPEHENAGLQLSAARAEEVLAAVLAAKTAVARQIAEVRRLMQDRDAKAKLVRKDLQTLMAELRVKVGLFGVAWGWFGLQAPGEMQQPEVPENVTVELRGQNATVKCDRAPRARRYRYWKKEIGVDEDFVLLASRRARDLPMWDLPPNVEMEIAVSASNNGGESLRSVVVRFRTGGTGELGNSQLPMPNSQ